VVAFAKRDVASIEDNPVRDADGVGCASSTTPENA
jgi:hypothetical protein